LVNEYLRAKIITIVLLTTCPTYLTGTTRVLMDELVGLLLPCTALLVFPPSLPVPSLHPTSLVCSSPVTVYASLFAINDVSAPARVPLLLSHVTDQSESVLPPLPFSSLLPWWMRHPQLAFPLLLDYACLLPSCLSQRPSCAVLPRSACLRRRRTP